MKKAAGHIGMLLASICVVTPVYAWWLSRQSQRDLFDLIVQGAIFLAAVILLYLLGMEMIRKK
jgi:hypothetical protein